MAAPRRILVRGVNWLGDAVMTTPALLRLREAHPAAHITLLTPAKLRDLWPGHPALDAVEVFDDGASAWSVARQLRAGNYDTGLILPNSPRSAIELWLAQIPERIGLGGNWRRLFLTRAVPPRTDITVMRKRTAAEVQRLIEDESRSSRREETQIKNSESQNLRASPATASGSAPPNSPSLISPASHQLYHYLHLAAALGARPEPIAPQLVVPDGAPRQFAQKFGLDPNPAAPLLGLNPGAEYGPAKRWPEDRFIAAALQVHQRLRCRWLIFGAKADTALAARITAAIQQAAGKNTVLNLAGQTSLAELCAGLKLCRALLTNDSGPMHVAAALGTPVVVPFGSTSLELTGPGLPGDPRHHLFRARPPAPCSPCFLRECPIDFRCMTAITVDQVVSALAP